MVLLDALAQLVANGSDARLVLVGDGVMRTRLVTRVAELFLPIDEQRRIILAGIGTVRPTVCLVAVGARTSLGRVGDARESRAILRTRP